MKKSLAAVLSAALVLTALFGFTACQESDNKTVPDTNIQQQQERPLVYDRAGIEEAIRNAEAVYSKQSAENFEKLVLPFVWNNAMYRDVILNEAVKDSSSNSEYTYHFELLAVATPSKQDVRELEEIMLSQFGVEPAAMEEVWLTQIMMNMERNYVSGSNQNPATGESKNFQTLLTVKVGGKYYFPTFTFSALMYTSLAEQWAFERTAQSEWTPDLAKAREAYALYDRLVMSPSVEALRVVAPAFVWETMDAAEVLQNRRDRLDVASGLGDVMSVTTAPQEYVDFVCKIFKELYYPNFPTENVQMYLCRMSMEQGYNGVPPLFVDYYTMAIVVDGQWYFPELFVQLCQ